MTNLKYVENCGKFNRTVFVVNDIYYIGCSTYDFKSACDAIRREYDVDKAEKYIKKISNPTDFDPDKYNWKDYSWAMARYCPEYFDPDKYNWKKESWAVAQHCPERFDPDKYNWEKDSWDVARYCPEYFDSDKYNWKNYSWAVAQYCPKYFDPDKYNWEKDSWAVARYCPEHFDPDKYNWEKDSWVVDRYCPEKMCLKVEGRMTKVFCEQCGKHIANIIDGDFVEIENWGMSESEQELCAECCKKEDQRELELEAAQCIWEAILVNLGCDDNIEDQICKSIGTVELRYQLRQRDILKACIDGWDLLEKKGGQEEMISYDWDYVPWFVKNCLDFDISIKCVSLRSDWKKIVKNCIKKEE